LKEETTILIVDDQEKLADTLRQILEMDGYRTEAVYTGRQALEEAKAYPYDAILLDIMLPDMQGTQLIPSLLESNPNTVIIMLTAFPDQKNTMEALNLGASGYLTKPLVPEKLLEILRKKLDAQRESLEMTQEKMGQLIQKRLEKLRKTS
jgi:DNA-binding response OmpR family regulator